MVFEFRKPASTEAQHRKDKKYNHHEANQINYRVHGAISCLISRMNNAW